MITIVVDRNQYAPYYLSTQVYPLPYIRTLQYDTLVPSDVFQVLAVDTQDRFNTVGYELLTTVEYANYFSIDIVTGIIKLNRDLRDEAVKDKEVFEVSLSRFAVFNHMLH